MPKAHPREFRDDVVAVARRGEAPVAEVAKDFGISESCLRNWLAKADVADGKLIAAMGAELRTEISNRKLVDDPRGAPLKAAEEKLITVEKSVAALRRGGIPV